MERKRIKIMKKANNRFRRELLAAEREGKNSIKRYPLNNSVHTDDEDEECVTLYAGGGVMVSCSANLFSPE